MTTPAGELGARWPVLGEFRGGPSVVPSLQTPPAEGPPSGGPHAAAPEVLVDPIFGWLVDHLRATCPELFDADPEVGTVRRRIGRSGPGLDYERDALAFNRAYFFKNLYKALVALAHLGPACRAGCPLLDVGSGAGVFTVAWAALWGPPAPTSMLADASAAQLRLAARVLAGLGLPPLRTVRVTIAPDALTPPAHPAPAHLRLFSYWFCEQEPFADRVADRAALDRQGHRAPRAWQNVRPHRRDTQLRRAHGLGRRDVTAWATVLAPASVVVDYPDVVGALAEVGSSDFDVAHVSVAVRPRPEFSPLFNEPSFYVHAARFGPRSGRPG